MELVDPNCADTVVSSMLWRSSAISNEIMLGMSVSVRESMLLEKNAGKKIDTGYKKAGLDMNHLK